MDKETAKALEAWLKAEKRKWVGHNSEFARGYRRALSYFGDVIKAAKAGDLEGIEDI